MSAGCEVLSSSACLDNGCFFRFVIGVPFSEVDYSHALLRSLLDGPLLVGRLPEADVWQLGLVAVDRGVRLNFQQKLGHLYEDALEQLVLASADWELLARNLQVFDSKKRTLGEIDFLIQEKRSGRVLHLELAVKFYLAVRDEAGVECFPGPDPRDNWSAKLGRFLQHQLRLCESEEAVGLLRARFGVEKVGVVQRIYGVMFDHVHSDHVSQPPRVDEGCRRGLWLRIDECDEYLGDVGFVKLVPKCLWPVRLEGTLLEGLESVVREELKARAKWRCVLFWDERRDMPVFLVPNDWPCGLDKI